ncbi:hypothetical protein [Parvibaculum sp.]|uniref:hypothetical protein n=1 Tax=Parvibaculum sp. TaxID=2024848 RepID=UPI001D4650AE|nr:hypothetical protein [Parvibaculum sp.]MBX3487855.1 hypothetical protein [Parvibaculum sp.]
MCFNKSSSASAQTQQTTTRDERIAADNGALIVRAEDSYVNVTIEDLSPEALHVAKVALDRNTNVVNTALKEGNKLAREVSEDMASVAMSFSDGVFNFANDVLGFASSTQASYQQAAQAAATEDATEIVQQFIQYAAIAMIAFFAFNYLQKAA